ALSCCITTTAIVQLLLRRPRRHPIHHFLPSPAPPRAAPSPLSLHDALPICGRRTWRCGCWAWAWTCSGTTRTRRSRTAWSSGRRSEEHTSELQSRGHLVCRLLLEKKKDGVSEWERPA